MERKISTHHRAVDEEPIAAAASYSASEAKESHITPSKPRKASSAIAMDAAAYDDISSQYPDDFDTVSSDNRPIRPKAQPGYNDPDPLVGDNQAMEREEYFPPGEHPLEGVDNFHELPPPEDLSGKSKEIADQGISALIGEYRARCLMSRTWGLRAAALTKTVLMLPEFNDSPGMMNCFPALMAMARVGLEDKMQQVFHEALALLESVLDLSKQAKLAKATVGPCVDPIIVNLIEKLSDTNIRIKDGAKRGLELLMHSPVVVGPTFISGHALKALNSKQQANWKVIVARLRLLHDMVSDFGLGANVGLSADAVMTYCKNLGAFAHGNGEVRDAAKDVTKAVQKLVGTPAISSYLADLRQKQLEEYFAAFGEPISETAANPAGKANAAMPKNSSSSSSAAKATSPKSSAKPAASSAAAAQAKSQPPSKSPAKEPSPAPAANAAGAPQSFTVCMFCGESDKTWNEDALDLHFWKSCPLLTPCPACAQVVEIAGLPEHLLDECEHKQDYVPCDTTGLAIRKADYPSWQRSKNCKPPPDNCVYCPLCLSSVEDSDEAWKDHLVHGCPKNTRTQS
jgi:centrosomal protein CEP104